jgi:hypothetical protein
MHGQAGSVRADAAGAGLPPQHPQESNAFPHTDWPCQVTHHTAGQPAKVRTGPHKLPVRARTHQPSKTSTRVSPARSASTLLLPSCQASGLPAESTSTYLYSVRLPAGTAAVQRQYSNTQHINQKPCGRDSCACPALP